MDQTNLSIIPTIKKRRTVRKYIDQPLEPEVLKLIMEAGLRAPSSKNKHTTQFIIVEDKEMLHKLSEMRPSGANFLQQVPIGVVVLGSPIECDRWLEDASLAAGWMQLQAEYLGVGSCWAEVLGRMTECGQDTAEYVRQLLDIPYQMEVVCVLGFGYPQEHSDPRPIESLKWEKIHLNKYVIKDNI